MPLTSIPGKQAFANLRGQRSSMWPDGRKDRVRLNGVALVGIEPTFELQPGEAVFTVGSCFARNIEQRLSDIGFDVPARAFALPADERASETENDFLNKYPPHSILNEVRWALDPSAAFPEDSYLQVDQDLWHDPHSAPNLKPAPLERVRERRAMVHALYREIPRCRVVVMTLGLVEAWFDEAVGLYLNGAPPLTAIQGNRDRFRLDVLNVEDVLGALKEIYDLLTRFGHPDFRMLLTVSPVPFRNTFTGKDAIAANTYSKSVLRVAAEMFVHSHPRADYFPSYEIVTHTVRSSAYIQDNRHVTPQVVNTIVDRVVAAYCPQFATNEVWEPIGARKAPAVIHKAIKTGDFAHAVALYTDLERKDRYLKAGYDEAGYRYDYGRLLLRIGRAAEAQAQLASSVALDPSNAGAHYQLARALARLQRPLEAEESFRRATELAPDSADMRLSYANQLGELQRFDEAETQVRHVLATSPDHPRAEAALETVQARRAAAEPPQPAGGLRYAVGGALRHPG